MSNSILFTSTELKVIEREDEKTNPFRFGKSVADWIAISLSEKGFTTEVCAEDRGWRIDCLSEPCPIWIGCGNREQNDGDGNWVKPKMEAIVWECFVEADVPFFKKLFKSLDPSTELEQITQSLTQLLNSTNHVKFVDENALQEN